MEFLINVKLTIHVFTIFPPLNYKLHNSTKFMNLAINLLPGGGVILKYWYKQN